MIECDIAEVTDVRLEVYDVLGRMVKTILDERLEVGRYRVRFLVNNVLMNFAKLKTHIFSKMWKLYIGSQDCRLELERCWCRRKL